VWWLSERRSLISGSELQYDGIVRPSWKKEGGTVAKKKAAKKKGKR